MEKVKVKKLLTALMIFSVFSTPTIAGTNQFENWKHNRQEQVRDNKQPNNYRKQRRHRSDGHNYWRGKKHNYWHGNDHNNNFYNDPYFWGGIAGGLIGGAIIRRQYYNEPECRYVWTEVYVPEYGYQERQVEVCD